MDLRRARLPARGYVISALDTSSVVLRSLRSTLDGLIRSATWTLTDGYGVRLSGPQR